jgi:hypothetical protein
LPWFPEGEDHLPEYPWFWWRFRLGSILLSIRGKAAVHHRKANEATVIK